MKLLLHDDLLIVIQGIEVPEVLRKYIPGQPEFLPYTKELPKETTSNKAKKSKGTEAPTQKMENLKV